METEHDPKQLHDLLERHRTMMRDGLILKTPVRIGSLNAYATLRKEQINMRYGGTFDIDVTVEIEMPAKAAMDLHGQIFFAMKAMNDLPPFQNHRIDPALHAHIYGRLFLINVLHHTNFHEKTTTVSFGCTYVVRLDEATIEKIGRSPYGWPEIDPLRFL